MTQLNEDEPPFEHANGKEDKDGIYADIVSGDALFSSADKLAMDDGWPGFAKPIEEGIVRKEAEFRGGQARTILRARLSHSYLGQFVQDGPAGSPPYYRINAAALRFVPLDRMEAEGYGRFLASFGSKRRGSRNKDTVVSQSRLQGSNAWLRCRQGTVTPHESRGRLYLSSYFVPHLLNSIRVK